MAVQITITEKCDLSSTYVRSFLQDRIVIGRARSADICLPDISVSTRHAEIRLKDNEYAVADLGSMNGTLVNGSKLVAHRPRLLDNGDEISMAGFKLVFNLGTAKGASEARDVSMRQAGDMLAKAMARSGSSSSTSVLEVVSGPGPARRFELPPAPASLIVGRDSAAEIRLDDGDVSRRHAEIVVEKDGIFVRDLKSRNGIVVGGDKVEAVEIKPGLKFKIGRTTLALEKSMERSLSAIMEAPEEATSSFAVAEAKKSSSDHEGKGEPSKPPQPQVKNIPIGPADPIMDSESNKLLKTTGHIPRPEVEGKSDLGLIIIGAIIIVASVAGLVYLFT